MEPHQQKQSRNNSTSSFDKITSPMVCMTKILFSLSLQLSWQFGLIVFNKCGSFENHLGTTASHPNAGRSSNDGYQTRTGRMARF